MIFFMHFMHEREILGKMDNHKVDLDLDGKLRLFSYAKSILASPARISGTGRAPMKKNSAKMRTILIV